MSLTDTTAAPEQAQASAPGAIEQEPALHLPLGLLKPSPTNPRRKFDPAKLQELADSIRETRGVFQPILARPNPEFTDSNGMPRYEIVAGERRWRASQLAGMATVLALVRDLDDKTTLKIQLKENVDRESLHELEEAEGIKRLIEETGATVEEVATMLNKGRRWVFARLALLNLGPVARELFLADKFKATVAGLIATIPTPSEQDEAAEHIAAGFGGEPFSFRSAAEELRKNFMLRLEGAPFNTTAPYQVAGPCVACPKRTGANADLFGEEEVKRGDMCQDRACFHAKAAEHREAQLNAAREAGHTVLTGEAARQLVPSAHYLPHGHLWFDQPAPALTTDPRPLREIFGAKQRDVITVELSSGGPLVSIVPEALAKKLLKTKGLLRAEEPAPKRPTVSEAATEAAHDAAEATASAPSAPAPKAKPKPTRSVEERYQDQLALRLLQGLRERLQAAEALPVKALRMLIEDRLADAYIEDYKLLYAAHGWELPALSDDPFRGHQSVSTLAVHIADHLDTMNGRELGELLIETLVLDELTSARDLDDITESDHFNMPTATLAKELGLDEQALQAIDRQAYDEARAEHDAETGAAPDATQAFVQTHAPAAGKRAPVKYRNSLTGETWSGRGLQPKWLKVAITEGGKSLADFEVQA